MVSRDFYRRLFTSGVLPGPLVSPNVFVHVTLKNHCNIQILNWLGNKKESNKFSSDNSSFYVWVFKNFEQYNSVILRFCFIVSSIKLEPFANCKVDSAMSTATMYYLQKYLGYEPVYQGKMSDEKFRWPKSQETSPLSSHTPWSGMLHWKGILSLQLLLIQQF